VGRSEGRGPLGRHRHRCEDNIKMEVFLNIIRYDVVQVSYFIDIYVELKLFVTAVYLY
jgi:hypothetical protein